MWAACLGFAMAVASEVGVLAARWLVLTAVADGEHAP